MRVVTHMSKVVHRRQHTVTGTLCNRMSNAGEDMNCEVDEALVTCKLCIKELDRLRARANKAECGK